MTKHGDYKSKLYAVWAQMKNRCNCKTCVEYHNYGARGIKVCDEWSDDYLAFKKWAMSHGYREGLTIDRIDNDGSYCPSNCRFATPKQQARNRRTNRSLTVGKRTMLACEWCEFLGINFNTVRVRLHYGCTAAQALGLVPLPADYKQRKARKAA